MPPRLTERDIGVLLFIGMHRAVHTGHVARLLSSYEDRRPLSAGTVRHHLLRYERLALIERRAILSDFPPVVWLTRRGARLVGAPERRGAPSLTTLRHTLRLVDVYFDVTDRGPDLEWTQPCPEADDENADAVILNRATGRRTAVELELVQKEHERTLKIVGSRCAMYDKVNYLVTRQARPAVERAVARLPQAAAEKVFIYGVETIPVTPAPVERRQS